jgi:4-hydroxy-2-oxoheptanedioate aldolase
MVGTREEAERFVAPCRYPPEGIRSVGPTRVAKTRMFEYVENANREIMTIAMIETREGFENLEDIVKTPGLDALFPGPGDLAMSYGEKPNVSYDDPKAVKRLRHIVDVAHAAGVKVVLPGPTRKMAEEIFKWGADWAMMGNDWNWALAGASQCLQDTRNVVAGK